MRLRQAIAAAVGLAAIATAWTFYARQQQRATEQQDREQELRQQLSSIRGAIRAFHEENGRYPRTLEELVPKQLPALPRDPFTGSHTSWRVTTEDVVSPNQDFTGSTAATTSYVVDVHSGAPAPYSGY